MGIVQEQRKKIENLEAKNRMLKRMYETQKSRANAAELEYIGALKVLGCAIVKAGGRIEIDRNDLAQVERYSIAVCVHKDTNTMEYYIPEIVDHGADVPDDGTVTAESAETE